MVFAGSCAKTCARDPFPDVEVPVVVGARDVGVGYNTVGPSITTKTVRYLVDCPYPAEKVVAFHDAAFAARGWNATKGMWHRRWETFVDATIDGAPTVRQRLALWTDPSRSIEAFLVLKYFRTRSDVDWNDELQVTLQIQPSINWEDLQGFERKLDRTGKREEFDQLLMRYSDENHRIDIDRAISENPNEPLLRELRELMHPANQ
jgi:hypothetical protein